MQKTIGVVPHLFARPLVYGLEGAGSKFRLDYASPTTLASKMREGALDLAFLSPIDYALNSSDYSIIPGIGVSSPTADRSVLLGFHQGLKNIGTVAVADASTSEVVLTRIILKEKHEIDPTFVPLPPSSLLSVEAMLDRADAALITGDDGPLKGYAFQSAFDLVDEWLDLTGLPFVHGFWVLRPNALSEEGVRDLRTSKERGINGLEEIAAAAAGATQTPIDRVQDFLKSLTFDLDDEDVDALRQFLRFAFYHGMIADVPELKFVRDARWDSDLDPNSLLN